MFGVIGGFTFVILGIYLFYKSLTKRRINEKEFLKYLVVAIICMAAGTYTMIVFYFSLIFE